MYLYTCTCEDELLCTNPTYPKLSTNVSTYIY